MDRDVQTSFAVASTVALVVALVANLVGQLRHDDERWFDARAVAESVKTSAWRYMLRVPPYDDDRTADQHFATQLTSILATRPDLRAEEVGADLTGTQQITDPMRHVRALPLCERVDWYRRHRLHPAIDWYSAKAASNRVSAGRWFRASLAVQTTAVATALLALAKYRSLIDGVAILATVTAAFTAWSQLRRHDDLGTTYEVAARELALIDDVSDTLVSEDAVVAFVFSAEMAISREHTMWVARRSHPPLATVAAAQPPAAGVSSGG